MSYCKFLHDSYSPDGKRFYRCRRCLRRTPHAVIMPPERVWRKCTHPGLGGMIENFLSDWGITKSRYLRWKARLLGIPLDKVKCGCLRRATALDRFGDRIIDLIRWPFIS
jgi:hypothetical protein